MITKSKKEKRARRHKRVRAKISGTSNKPRLSVFKSNTRIIAQIIDDENSTTLASVSSSDSGKKTMRERLEETGKNLAESATKKKITSVVFDRGGFIYTGNIKVFAESARKNGLTF